MSIPQGAPYVVVGAGIHGLSTAYHLAKELRSARSGIGRGRRRPRQVEAGRRRVRDRVRRRPQQLLPAGDERAHAGLRGGLGIGPGGLPLQLGRLHRARCAGAGVRSRGDLRAPGADRLPLGADHGRGRGRRAHEGALPGLARPGRDRSACTSTRAASRSTSSPCSGCATSASPRMSPSSRASRSPDSPHATTARSRPSRRARVRSRSASRSSSRPARGPRASGRCSTCPTRSTSGRRRATSCATARCGRTGTSRKARSPSTRSCSRPRTEARRP